jgi:transcriptional regulator with XRE-family HTH domain
MSSKHILDAIVATMESRGVSQGDLASGLGCSQTTISRLLRGLTQITVDDLFRIAHVLQVNPQMFMDHAVQKAPQIVNLPPEVQTLFCSDDVGYHLFNRLKKPQTFAELVTFFKADQLPLLRKKIQELKERQALIEDIDGKIRLNFPDAEALFFTQDRVYNSRITELYGLLREEKLQLPHLAPRETETWKRLNGDAVVVEYFTQGQIEEQKALLLQLYNFVRSQLRANRMSPPRADQVELRAIYLSSLPYPSLRQGPRG